MIASVKQYLLPKSITISRRSIRAFVNPCSNDMSKFVAGQRSDDITV